MHKQKHTKKLKLVSLSQRIRLATVALFTVAGTYFLIQAQAAAGYIYIAPATASRYVGDTFSVQVRIQTTSAINAAFVDLNYNGIGLQVLSIQRGADFPNQNAPTEHTPSSTGTGRIKMQSTRNSSAAGDFHYATITFKARTTGTYGISPLASSHLINYPQGEVSFTFGRGDYSFSNSPAPALSPPPPPPPPPPPTPPTSAPPPTPPSSKPPSPPAAGAKIPKTESAPSASNLKISNFTITDIGYRSAVLSWETNKPAITKVNFGYTSSHMPYEIVDPARTTGHRAVVQGDIILAGNQYAARITSDDGAGPVTLDGEFSTKAIRIAVKVTDSQDQLVSGATVRSGTFEALTENGVAELTVGEGSIPIRVEKGDLSGRQTATITVPLTEDAPPQQVTIVLATPSESAQDAPSDSTSTAPASKKQGGSSRVLWVVLLGGAGLAGVAFLLWRKRRKAAYGGPSVTVVSDMTGPTHTPSLPELVRQDLAAKRNQSPQPKRDEPEDIFSALDHPGAPPPQPAHTEPHAPPPKPKPPEPPKPPQHPAPEHHAPAPPEHPKKPHVDADVDPKDHSLHIHHDD